MNPPRFYKLHGAGNDFVLLDTLKQSLPETELAALARRLCDRRFGVGADGLLLVEASSVADYRMRILNADGSEAPMCGNGIRCFARYLFEYHRLSTACLTVETGAGIRGVFRQADGRFTVEMGRPRVANRSATIDGLEFFLVDTGAPHAVAFVNNIEALPLETLGPQIEYHPLFPERTNVSVAQVERADSVQARFWERGAGATLACGTGACAIAVAGVLRGDLRRRISVRTPGGVLQVEWHDDDTLWLTGEATLVFEGTWIAPLH
ncbi:MAG: diaminopimelate epimerase [Fimbriimonadales bacterium]|nr:diaminopimelate epimerase [Fimbriimonadales bacterium]